MRKSVRYILASLLAVAVMLPAAAADTPNPQKPGKWQIKMQMEMPGMPVKMPPVTTEVCVTEEDLKDPQSAVPNDPKLKCTVSDYKIDGSKVSWSVDCPAQKMKGHGEMTFSDTAFTGWTEMLIGENEMKTKYSGKWLGECTK